MAYDKFATLYSAGGYDRYSQQMAGMLAETLKQFNHEPKEVLDIACGEGSFALALARQGYAVTGVDLSKEMIGAALKKAKAEGLSVDFHVQDMRQLSFEDQFDLVTSWFDSLNYMLTWDDLLSVFEGAARALRKGGLFIFDMNTIYGLAFAYWQLSPYRSDSEDLLMLHRFTDFDYDQNTVTMNITCFTRDGEVWRRFDEIHRERGYTLTEIESALAQAGLTKLALWGNPSVRIPPQPNSPRVWFVARK